MNRVILFVVAVLIGIAVAAANNILFSLLANRPFAYSSDVEPVHAVIVAIPFIALAVTGARLLRPWIVGLALTLALWGYVLYDGVSYQWNPDGSGANIGLGFIMMASPLFITPIVLAVYAFQDRAGRESSIDRSRQDSL